MSLLSDEHGSKESQVVNDKLEKIDGETDNLGITFVKLGDPRYARKWGVTKLPAVVYFRKRFPSIYRGTGKHVYHRYCRVPMMGLPYLHVNMFRHPI